MSIAKNYSNDILTIRIVLQLSQYSEYTVVSPIVVIFALQVNFFFFFYKKHEIFNQLEKRYNRESKQTLGEIHKQLHTTLHNEPKSPTTFLSLHINIFGISFLGL